MVELYFLVSNGPHIWHCRYLLTSYGVWLKFSESFPWEFAERCSVQGMIDNPW